MMNVVRSRDEFIDYCFRQLGEPVIQVNIDQEQAEDRVNDALQMFFNIIWMHRTVKLLLYK